METLDKFDVAILRELQSDARLTNAELAQRVGLSAAPCWRRVRALEEAGYIKGYHAEIDRHKIGLGVLAWSPLGRGVLTGGERPLPCFQVACDRAVAALQVVFDALPVPLHVGRCVAGDRIHPVHRLQPPRGRLSRVVGADAEDGAVQLRQRLQQLGLVGLAGEAPVVVEVAELPLGDAQRVEV